MAKLMREDDGKDAAGTSMIPETGPTAEVGASTSVEGKDGVASGAPEVRRRWASGLSLPTLGLIVASFFLPTVQVCGIDEPLRGYDFERWVYPLYGAAALLFILTVAALVRRHSPGRVMRIAALVSLVVCFGTWLWIGWKTLVLPLRNSEEVDWGREGFGVVYLLATGIMACLLILRGMSRGDGWQRWHHFLASYACLAASLVFYSIAYFIQNHGAVELLIGWDMFAGAVLVLLFIAPCASWLGRD